MLRSGTVISLHELYATGKSIREIVLLFCDIVRV